MTSKHSQAPILISQGVFDSMKTFDQFEQKVSGLFATNTKAQGDAFEIFVEAYLATQPILQCQVVNCSQVRSGKIFAVNSGNQQSFHLLRLLHLQNWAR